MQAGQGCVASRKLFLPSIHRVFPASHQSFRDWQSSSLKLLSSGVEGEDMDDSTTSFAIPDELPVLPLRDMVVFPYMVLPLFVARERSITAVEDALAGDRLLMVVAQRDGSIDAPEPDDLYRVGTVVMVMRILRMSDGRVKVLVQGIAKATIDSFVEHEDSNWVRLTPKLEEDDSDWCVEAEALVRAVRGHVEELLPLKNLPPEVLSITANVSEPGSVSASVPASVIDFCVSSAVDTDCGVAVGASLTALTVIVTVPSDAESEVPSLTLNVKLSPPL